MIRAPSVHSQDDPLTLALRPPPFETEEERDIRLREEAEAKETSDKIDEDIKLEKQRLQKAKGNVKVYISSRFGTSRVIDLWMLYIASLAGSGGVGKIHFAETISADV